MRATLLTLKLWPVSYTHLTAFSLSYISVQAEDFKGQEEKYIKLCSSSKLTDKQQKTCQEFNTYLKDKNKELAKDTKETQKNVKNTENTIQDIIKQMTDLEAKEMCIRDRCHNHHQKHLNMIIPQLPLS